MRAENIKELAIKKMSNCGLNIKENVKLSQFTSFHIGGNARYYVVVKKENEFINILRCVRENTIKYVVLGGGTNVLISDNGFDGLVIHTQMDGFDIRDNGEVFAEAGVILARLAGQTVEKGFKGLEWAVGIPGRLGGAIRGNAGAMNGEIKNVITNIRCFDLDSGSIIVHTNNDAEFAYRESKYKKSNHIILSCEMKLDKGDKNAMLESIKKYLETRNKTQPKGFGSSGCIYKNYLISENEVESFRQKQIPESMLIKKSIAAGWLIENVGLKGKKIGQAQISVVHANFIVNLGGATAEDVRKLACLVQEKVKEKFGIILELEVQFIGF